jgi:hypothetical protein
MKHIPTLSQVMMALTLLIIIFCSTVFLTRLVFPQPKVFTNQPVPTYTWSHHGEKVRP